jgi:3-oxoacyl-[acyl-carrier protein] reductase
MHKKVAIVTGGGTGIGIATCVALARVGYNIVVSYSSSKDGAEQAVKKIKEEGGEALAVQASVQNETDVVRLFKTCIDTYGKINAVINNAGIGWRIEMVDLTVEDYEKVFDVNVRGTFLMCREAARTIEDGGRIVNISTGATRGISAGMSIYTASKSAVEAFGKVLAKELGPREITVNNVLPGMIDTPMLEGKATPRDKLEKMGAAATPFGRIGQPDEIADVVVMLCTEAGRFLSGQSIGVDGGTQTC